MPQQTGSARSYELLLIAVIAARATSFIFSKMILESLAPFNLLAVRFIIAFVLLARRRHRRLYHSWKTAPLFLCR